MPYESVSFPIGGKDVYRGLIVLYTIIVAYAALTVYFGAVTVGRAAGPLYADLFPIALSACGIAALYGVVRSRYTRRVWLEYAGTLLLLAGLIGYAGAIIWSGLADGEHYRLPAALLPVMVAVFPAMRLKNILKVVRGAARAKRAAALAQKEARHGVVP